MPDCVIAPPGILPSFSWPYRYDPRRRGCQIQLRRPQRYRVFKIMAHLATHGPPMSRLGWLPAQISTIGWWVFKSTCIPRAQGSFLASYFFPTLASCCFSFSPRAASRCFFLLASCNCLLLASCLFLLLAFAACSRHVLLLSFCLLPLLHVASRFFLLFLASWGSLLLAAPCFLLLFALCFFLLLASCSLLASCARAEWCAGGWAAGSRDIADTSGGFRRARGNKLEGF